MNFLPGKRLIKAFISFVSAVVILIINLLNPVPKPFVPEPEIVEPYTGPTVTIAQNGQSEYKIIRGQNCSPSEKYAAEVLQDYLRKISGVTIPIFTDAEPSAEKEIVVGRTNREGVAGYTVDRASLGDEGLTVKTVGKRVVIAGGEKRGTLYGVFAFLEEALGCRWFTPTLIHVPQASQMKIPAELNFTQKPYFEYRDTNWTNAYDKLYSIANRLNGNTFRSLSEEQGGDVGFIGGFCHTFTTSIMHPSKYFDEHPEYYTLGAVTGVRSPDQLCLTNPDTLRIVIEEVRELLESGNSDGKIVSLTHHDNMNYCVCENCKAVDDYEGSHSGTMIHFVNAVADALKDEYPNVAFETFAYTYTQKPPAHTVPRPNVIVRLCSISCCFAHPIDDPLCIEDSTNNIAFYKDLRAWKKICNRLYMWDYTTNFAHYVGPCNNFGVLQRNVQIFNENNVKGVFEQGNHTAHESNAEFADLRCYLISRLLWNPYLDYDKTMNEFLKAYYGAGWQYVREYIDMTIKHTGKYGFHTSIYRRMHYPGVFILSPKQVVYCNDLWAKAAELAENETHLRRVRMSQLSWRYWKACNKRSEFSRLRPKEEWRAENEALYNDYQKYGIIRCSEGNYFSANPDFYSTPDKWR
ncbi:MAG: DUF4838 domain-containing protein [Acutalibacteraceae bacterium]|jgi:hypothetical protein